MKIQLDFQLRGLDGKELEGEGVHAGKMVAAALAHANKGAAIKLYDWASKLYNREPIEVDDTDKEVLVGFIETSESITNLVKAQVLKAIKATTPATKK